MPRTVKTLLLGLLLALLGVLAGMLPPAASLEEDIGLGWLFKLRGARPPPAGVVVVSIDRESSSALGLPNTPRKWPRSLHARLVSRLQELGARVVAFDVIFEEARAHDQDLLFAQACRAAGNVVLFEYLKRDAPDGESANLQVETQVPPIPELAGAADALAPFPLPKVPIRVNDFWLFKPGAGDVPTLPVIALQVYARPYRAELLRLLKQTAAQEGLSGAVSTLAIETQTATFSQDLRQLLLAHPGLAARLAARIQDSTALPDASARAALAALVAAYRGADSRNLDFYGPPRSIPTLPYHQVLHAPPNALDLRGKAVFVGFSEQFQPEQKDGFYTVFSRPDGLDMSGVEIAATAFANLLEGRSVAPLAPALQVLVVGLWGMLLGTLLLASAAAVVPLSALLAGAYLGLAYLDFAAHGTWLPLVVPLLAQLPVALLGALLWRYLDVRRERQRMRLAFAHYLPDQVVDALSRGSGAIGAGGEVVHGVCLATDAEQYSAIAERLQPDALHSLLNRYYAALFEPVRRRGGFISDVVGDAMLAIWASRSAQASLRAQACHAALDIVEVIDGFNRSAPQASLPTRLGLHCGEIMLGNVGAGDHFEYRAVGDIVNTATRIEGLNKTLNTRALASAQMVQGVEDIVTRELGSFRLSGKTQALVIHELVGRAGQIDTATRARCAGFAEALADFRARRWQQAIDAFRALLVRFGEDGPARYYLRLADQYAVDPPPASWDGILAVRQK